MGISNNMGDNSILINWGEFKPHLITNQKDLFKDKHFADVTLITDDEKQLKAHKVILSACSPFFRNMLITNPHSHPMFFMKGIKNHQMKALLQFMYCGETRIFDDLIDEFISIAQDLKIKELSSKILFDKSDEEAVDVSVHNDADCKTQSEKSTHSTFAEISEFIGSQDHITGPSFTENEDQIELVENNKDHEDRHEEQSHIIEDYGQHHEKIVVVTEERSKKIAPIGNALHKCHLCDTVLSSKHRLRIHIESIHQGIRYPCDQCNYKATNKDHLKRHNQIRHQEPKISCDSCDFKTATQDYLKNHKMSHHSNIKFQCHICDYRAGREVKVKQHIKVKHATTHTVADSSSKTESEISTRATSSKLSDSQDYINVPSSTEEEDQMELAKNNKDHENRHEEQSLIIEEYGQNLENIVVITEEQYEAVAPLAMPFITVIYVTQYSQANMV